MDLHGFNVTIPLEVNDIIKAEGYINRYKVLDIIFIYSTKDKKVDIYLELEDIDSNYIIKLPYKDYKWNIEIVNVDVINQ